jgi:hypothetical protein
MLFPQLSENAELARAVLEMKPQKGIPQWMLHVMDIPLLEEVSGAKPGSYEKNPEEVYLAFQRKVSTCFIDQYIPRNPLTMTSHGFDSHTQRGATTGAEHIEVDGVLIDSPEAVVEHMERILFPKLTAEAASINTKDEAVITKLIEHETTIQKEFGTVILKVPYDGFQIFPYLRYGMYGYVNYLMAYALYPDLMAKDFRLQADVAVKKNAIHAAAILKGGLPKVVRLDHDMTDSRGTLVDVKTLDEIWFPQFARCIKPLLDVGIRLIWHCDGNVMTMVPRLIEAGIGGFQGFQYEDGVDYEAICRMKTRDKVPLMIWAGSSVTRTLPFGKKEDVVKELKWLVEKGPKVGLCLGGSSSIAPSTNHENVKTLIEGLAYYRTHGR